MEEGLARFLRLPVDPETVPLELCSYVHQPLDLLSFPVDAAPVHSEEDFGRQATIPGEIMDSKCSMINWQLAFKTKTEDGLDSIRN